MTLISGGWLRHSTPGGPGLSWIRQGSELIIMNRIKRSWVGSLCLTILLFFLCACSTTAGSQTTSAQAGATGATAVEEQIAQAVFQAINQSRSRNGLPALTWSTALANSARQHDLAMPATYTLSYQRPGNAALVAPKINHGATWFGSPTKYPSST